jgi:hypothetical protein
MSGWGDRRDGLIKRLTSLLSDSQLIFPKPAHYGAGGRLVHLDKDTAALIELELDDSSHQISQQHAVTCRLTLGGPHCQELPGFTLAVARHRITHSEIEVGAEIRFLRVAPS